MPSGFTLQHRFEGQVTLDFPPLCIRHDRVLLASPTVRAFGEPLPYYALC